MKFTGVNVGTGTTVEFTMAEEIGAADEGMMVV